MKRTRVVVLKRAELERVFVKLLASKFNSLSDVARLLGLPLREALEMEKKLREEVLLEQDYNELKQLLKNGNK